VVADSAICAVLSERGSAQDGVNALLELVRVAGAPDNVACVVVDVAD
jgi:serine/threonine protein phosphatase PrpC